MNSFRAKRFLSGNYTNRLLLVMTCVILGYVNHPLKPPYLPMQAISARSIPEGDEWLYEPLWDGIRCLAFKNRNYLELESGAQKILTPCFPEIIDALRLLEPATFVLDGELIITEGGNLSFDYLLMRLNQDEQRARKLAEEHPAVLLVFDLLSDEDGKVLVNESLRTRRAKLERFAERFLNPAGAIRLSPATSDVAAAREWLTAASESLEGVLAKRLDLEYQHGSSRGMRRIARVRSAYCVVGGITRARAGQEISSLLLGLYEDGLLHFVGSVPLNAAEGSKLSAVIDAMIQPPGFTGRLPNQVQDRFGDQMRKWEPVASGLVTEVQYEHFDEGRFRPVARFLRWRPDQVPEDCVMDQVEF